MMKKWTYLFGINKTEGKGELRHLLGGKGANLAEMANLGLPIPPGLTLTTEACLDFMSQQELSQEIRLQVLNGIAEVELYTGKKFGGTTNPLLFSVRSGARISMPGMMDTILNLGLNQDTVEALAKDSNNPRFAWDSYRRFIQMYAQVVMGLNGNMLEAILLDLLRARGLVEDQQLSVNDLKLLVDAYQKFIQEESGDHFPQDPHQQLWLAISAVFKSWNNPRAIKYRELNSYPHHWGTAVTIQSMVFGNLGDQSATGVCFTRNPSNGERYFFGEFLINAQGEDVVAGIRTPNPLNNESKNIANQTFKTLSESLPCAYDELCRYKDQLEKHYKDMQDIEFTIENNRLYILQTRNGKRTTEAGIKIAVEMVTEGLINKEEAIKRIRPEEINQLLHPCLSKDVARTLLAKGLPASPGAASGRISFTSEQAEKYKEAGIIALLVRDETSPEDINGMVASSGILTARGGMTSHAAVVARGMGKPCVSGCQAIHFDHKNGTVKIGEHLFKEGDELTIDGESGEIFKGIIPTIPPQFKEEFHTFMTWADEFRTLKIRTNADTPADGKMAKFFGAEGIGLCRTEHMFFSPERLKVIREMIFAKDLANRKQALEKLIPFQRQDFKELFEAMEGMPVNIRLLDPPLHEFLPKSEKEISDFAAYMSIGNEEVKKRNSELEECNPMLGHRGCRLSISYPEICRMQVRAIIEAAILCKKDGQRVKPEIMVPLIASVEELRHLKKIIRDEIDSVFTEQNELVEYKIGTMIELPRAAIMACEISKEADFFSFGTNDLTQTTYGLSRDDAGKFLGTYLNQSIIECDPFVHLDQQGVGFLIKHATTLGRTNNPQIHLGICGEHGGDPKSIRFCHDLGLDYVSCSPFRVPIARLAAAQAAVGYRN